MANSAAVQEWQPNESGVHQICQLLAEYQKPGCNQAQILQQLRQCTLIPDFNNYLCYILARSENLPVEVRQSAGLLLKNNLKQQIASTPPVYRQYIQSSLLQAMGLSYRPLRQTAGTAISSIVGTIKLAAWQELLPALGQALQGEDVFRQEGGLDTIYKICEENADQFEAAVLGAGEDGMGAQLLPLLLGKFCSDNTPVRRLALCVMNIITRDIEEGHDEVLNTYLHGLFSLANDDEPEIRTAVCTGMIQMLASHPNRLGPFMNQIIEYMIKRTQDVDENVALESCEFWTAFCEAQIEPAILKPFLPQLVPILLKNLIYLEDDDAVIKALEAENQDGEDQDKDIKPFFSGQHSERNNAADGPVDDGEDASVYGSWTLRKCSAAGLDLLSGVFGDELLAVLMPTVLQRLQSEDWKARESAILVLGAVAEGCRNGLEPHLTEMIDVLLPKLSDPQPLVRIISCWAIGRYSERVIYRATNGGTGNGQCQVQIDRIIFGILKCMVDKNKQVQEAACSALACVEEVAGDALLPRLKTILEHLALACTEYGRKNLRLLYDALSTLADSVGRHLAEPQYRSLIMPALQKKWHSFQDTDHDLLPLLECLTALAIAFGASFEEYAKPMFERCVSIISIQFEAKHALQAGQPTTIRYNKDFIVSALDLLSGIAEGIGASVESLVSGSPVTELLAEVCKEEHPDVRQSGFALLGDLARACPGHLQPMASEFCNLATLNLSPQSVTDETKSVCNNACWSLGELAVNTSPDVLRPFAVKILESAVHMLMNARIVPRSILENVVITLGRVARVCPEDLAPHLEHYIGPWCQILRSIRDDVEKEHAFLGLCKVVRLNPQGATLGFRSFCEAVASWRRLNNKDLQQEMTEILLSFKNTLMANGQWEMAWLQFQEPLRQKLNAMCGL